MDNIKLQIEYLPIEALEQYANNTRKHGAEDIAQIQKSIQKFGFSDPIGIWSDHNVIVEGHGRLAAAKGLGMKEVPVIRLDHMTDEERRQYGIMHNKTAELSQWDFEMLEKELEYLDMSDFDVDFGASIGSDDFDDPTEVKEVDTPEVPEVATVKRGQRYRLGDHILMCGDSTSEEDVAKLMDGELASLLVTDPPYNVSIGITDIEETKQLHRRTDGLVIENDSWQNDDEFVDFLNRAFTTALDNMNPGAAFYIWYASTQSYNFYKAYEKANMTIRQQLTWVKNTFALGRQDYQWRHEPCSYGWKDGAGHYFIDIRNLTTVYDDQPDIDNMSKDEMKELLHEIYEDKIPTTIIHEDKPSKSELHPTMKPIKLIAQQVRNSSKPGDIVLDIFGGSGTTLITCEQLNRKCRMMEYDPHYADVIIKRWEDFTGRKAELIE